MDRFLLFLFLAMVMCGGTKDKIFNVLARHQALWLSCEAGNRVNSFHWDLKAIKKKEASLLLSKRVLIVSGNISLKHYNCVRSLNLRAAADARMQTSPRGTWNVQTWGSSLRKQRAQFIFLVFFNSSLKNFYFHNCPRPLFKRCIWPSKNKERRCDPTIEGKE